MLEEEDSGKNDLEEDSDQRTFYIWQNKYPNNFVGAEMLRMNILIYSDIKKGTKRIFNY